MTESQQGQNHLLAALESGELEKLQPEVVELPLGAPIYEAGQPVEALYFPHNALMSLVAVMGDGRIAETGTVGREGYTGSEAVFADDNTATSRCLVQIAGNASKVPLSTVRGMLGEQQNLRGLLAAYAKAFLAQVLQSVACNATHTVEQRCARWLLMTQDRAEADTFVLTQEFLAVMLGVRRASVNSVSHSFQETGLIRYSRGKITILDRAGLAAASCECYEVVKRVFEQVLPYQSKKS